MLRCLLPFSATAWLIFAWAGCHAADNPSRQQAESRLNALKAEISALQKNLERSRTTLSEEQKALRAADLEIQKSALQLNSLESARQKHEAELLVLHDERRN